MFVAVFENLEHNMDYYNVRISFMQFLSFLIFGEKRIICLGGRKVGKLLEVNYVGWKNESWVRKTWCFKVGS